MKKVYSAPNTTMVTLKFGSSLLAAVSYTTTGVASENAEVMGNEVGSTWDDED